MYWNNYPVTSVHLDSLLSKKDVTLQEIMDNEAVLQECKSQNTHLINYLIRTDVLEKLVSLTTEEPPGDDDTTKYKYPNIACELLTSEVPQLSESIADNEALLRKLYSFLDGDIPLNPLLASFFSKTFSKLIIRNSEQNWYSYQFTCLKVLEFLKLKEDSISLLLKHLGTSAIMDLVFKLITKVEGSEMKDDILNWLDEQRLVQKVVALLDPTVDSDVQYNAAQLLCGVIRTLRMNRDILEPNKILDRIESPEVVSLLLDHIFKEPKCETSIVGGISVLLTLLDEKCENIGPYDYEDPTQSNADFLKVVASTTKAILPRLKDFHNILINPPVKPVVRTTITVLDPPLGNLRVEVAKLLSVLVAWNKEEINKELAELDTINVLLDLFFKYTWNNFLHTQVQKCLAFALSAECTTSESGEIKKNGLIAHILSKCQLIQRILNAWQDNETQQTEHNRPRRGYMGHLTDIAHSIVQLTETHSFGALLKETVDNETLNKWDTFVSTKLTEIFETYSICLNRGHPSSNDKDGNDGKDGSFGDFSQTLYSNYNRLQALAPAFTGEFGSFREEQFNDDEGILNTTANPNFQKINFNVNEEDTDQQAVFFEKVCAQKFQTLDDYNGGVWNQDLTASKPNDNAKREWQVLENSSSDEEDEESMERTGTLQSKDNVPMGFNILSSWPGEGDIVVPPAQTLNPWESSGVNAVASPDLGWANFESAPFVANFGLNLTPDINTTIATSASYEIDTIPLDLTPSENNSNIDEIFLKEGGEAPMETPKVTENNPMSIVYTDLEIITKAVDKVSLHLDNESMPTNEGVKQATHCGDTSQNEPVDKGEEDVKKREKVIEANSFEKNAEIHGDVNSAVKINEEKELLGNFRFLSSQGLMTNSEREPESGDSYQLLKENVQAVPKETTQTSNKEIGSNSPEDKSANGPI